MAVMLLSTSCMLQPDAENSDSGTAKGFVSLQVYLNPANHTLEKTASGSDTVFSLDSLNIILSAPGASTQTYSYPLHGTSDTGTISFATQVYSLAALRMWKAKILTIDTSLNPARKDTVNLDSVTFTVYAGDTAQVVKTVNAVFSVLQANFISNSPSSLANTIKYLRIQVDGTTEDSLLVGDTLRGLYFPAAATGFAVGSGGTLLKTANTAANWSAQTSGTTRTLLSVAGTSATVDWVVGDSGTILHTTNGGTSWASQSSGTSQNLNAVYFQSANNGWAVGNDGVILATTNGGTKWTAQTSGTTQNLNGVYFQNANTGWAVGNDGVILATTNGGTKWTAQTSGSSQNLGSVISTNANKVWVAGVGGLILATTNGGTNWASQSSGTTVNLHSIYMQSATVGWAAGDSGKLLTTSNGSSWNSQSSGTSQNLLTVMATSATAVYAAGFTSTLLNTSNGGTGWTLKYFGTKTFDHLLSYKYLKPNVSHTLIMDAMDTLSTTLRGYQKVVSLNLATGVDTTITPSGGLVACGGSQPACTTH